MEQTQVPPRSEVPRAHTWNAESVFADARAWEAELQALLAELDKAEAFKGQLQDSPVSLKQALHWRDETYRRALVVYMYAQMHQAVDNGDQQANVMVGKAQSMLGRLLGTLSFFDPELLAIGKATLDGWLAQDAELAIYAHALDNLFRQQEHVRSAEVEELLGGLADPFSGPGTIASLLTDADMKFKAAVATDGSQVELSQGNYDLILTSPDRALRRSAWESYTGEYLAHKNTLAACLATSIKMNVFNMHARRHPSTLEASLFANNVPTSVFFNLIETFKKNLPTWQRYFRARAKALGVSDLQVYDIWAPLTAERPQIPYEQAVEWISAGLQPLGEDYAAAIRQGCLRERWVDIYPNLGKFSGAFSYGAPGTYPFIVMSYTGEIFSLSTLAHELGHSMHSYLTWRNQPVIYSDMSLFIAEVASNFHQAMVRGYLLEQTSDPAFQIAIIEEAMANFYRYFFTMPTLARFELEAHQRLERGEGLSAENLNALMADLFEEAYGDTIKIDRERYGITWATFGHLYADYYVYQYATGISAANALSRRILAGQPGAAESYRKFLSAGSSLYPLEALQLAGVDMTSPEPVEEAFEVLTGYVERLEQLISQ